MQQAELASQPGVVPPSVHEESVANNSKAGTGPTRMMSEVSKSGAKSNGHTVGEHKILFTYAVYPRLSLVVTLVQAHLRFLHVLHSSGLLDDDGQVPMLDELEAPDPISEAPPSGVSQLEKADNLNEVAEKFNNNLRLFRWLIVAAGLHQRTSLAYRILLRFILWCGACLFVLSESRHFVL